MQMLERIDQQSAALSARSERLKMMKLQYERYFAKLMQTQPVRCIPGATELNIGVAADAVPISAVSASTQIPVLLPAQPANSTLPTNAFGGGENSVHGGGQPAQPITASNEPQPAALTPRMWTFAMATPTPAGLLLTGPTPPAMPTASLPTATTPYEFLQYPLGYAPILQQPIHQQAHYTAPTSYRTSLYGNRANNPPQTHNDLLREKKLSFTSSYVPTAEAATSTEFPMLANESHNTNSDLLETPNLISKPHDSNEVENSQAEGSSNIHRAVHTLPLQTPTSATDEPLSQQIDYDFKAYEQSPDAKASEPSSGLTEVRNKLSEVHLEDDENSNDVSTYMNRTPIGNFEKPSMITSTPYSYEGTKDKPKVVLSATEDGEGGEHSTLSTAEDHLKKFAEIERIYGPIFTEEENDNADLTGIDYQQGLKEYKPFSEIINPKSNLTEDKPTVSTVESMENQSSWQSHTGSIENAPSSTSASISTASKPVSIDNIENAIYGELVNPHLSEPKAPNMGNAAQGFFTELLGQQDPTQETDDMEKVSSQKSEQTAKRVLETSTPTTNTDKKISVDDVAGLEYKTEASLSETQNQAAYDTSDAEAYLPTSTPTTAGVYGAAETTNNYAEYPTEQTIDPNATDASNLDQQEQQSDYAQQDYGNYDPSQYGNYDPNAYPGYIYDEASGQYVVDPQYVAGDGSTMDVAYAAPDYGEQVPHEQQQQQQLDYQNAQSQEVSYGYEESTLPTPPATTADVTEPEHSAAAETSIKPTSEPASADPVATPAAVSAPKVLKPTSILSTAEKNATQTDAQKKKKRVNFVDSSETDDSSGAKLPGVGAATVGGSESDFDFSSGAETSVG
ncbi:uncharacterized protein LOC101458897 [Ceratitis capitata]|nr:uncharacterized protein LOC101458897 [Ceratitis capitata]